MAANELSFTQLATVLAEITQQATGQAVAAPVDTASFVSVANTALLTGYDNIMNAVSQVLSRTIFSVRPYQRTFKGLEVSPARYGNHIRKLSAPTILLIQRCKCSNDITKHIEINFKPLLGV